MFKNSMKFVEIPEDIFIRYSGVDVSAGNSVSIKVWESIARREEKREEWKSGRVGEWEMVMKSKVRGQKSKVKIHNFRLL